MCENIVSVRNPKEEDLLEGKGVDARIYLNVF
jgi:hypothetical protein